MRACVLTATGGIEHLKVSDVPDAPPPATGEVRVAIRAAALNHLDLFVVQGLPGSEHQFPHIGCADGAGVIESVGPGVLDFRPGARVIVTSSDGAKLALARQLGADITFNHQTQQVAQEVRALTKKRGVDVVVDNVGAATWDDSLRCLRRGGRLVICGATSGPQVGLDLRRLFWHHWSILGSTMGNAAEYGEIVRRSG